MSSTKYTPQFPKLFKQWREHDLAQFRPSFYMGLSPEHELDVWEFIERQYLVDKFTDMIRVEFEWESAGLWGIPFPGSVQLGTNLHPDDLSLPPDLVTMLKTWHDDINCNARPFDADDAFDYAASHAAGFEVAKAIKLFMGKSYYVEYRPFRELVITDDCRVVELDIPAFILNRVQKT